jgi:hypothetical protein
MIATEIEQTESLAPSQQGFLAEAIWRQRHTLAEARPHTRRLHDALRAYMPPGHPGDLPFHEWGQLIASAVEFAPDVILEIGRGYGNSTLSFTQAANLLKPLDCRVVSVCLHPWEEAYAAVLPAATPEWFSGLSVLRGDVRDFDCAAALRGARRVLVFWDAHGYDVADYMLGRLMPVLADREHLVIMHDIGDARYQDARSYNSFGVWKGEEVWPGPMVRLGNVFATVQQAVSIVDFTSRNGITLHSAVHSLRSRFDAKPDDVREMRDLAGDFFDVRSGCAWFTLNEAAGPYVFPGSDAAQGSSDGRA